jgi:ammonium transporter Rh
VFDAGGSMSIHVFGAYCGLTCSAIIGLRLGKISRSPIPSYISCVFAMLGTLALWIFWPSFNSATFTPAYEYQRLLIIHNTILSLTGSTVSTFAFSIFYRGRFNMDDVLNATLAGGVAMGASSSFITNPAGAIAVGFIAGMVSTTGYYYLTDILSDIRIYDTCGINNLHGMPGLIGGLSSAVFCAAYNVTSLDIAGNNPLDFAGVDYMKQGGLQVAGTFVSMGIGIVTGAISGLIIYLISEPKEDDFYDDEHYWEIHHSKHGEPAPYYVVQGAKPDSQDRLNLNETTDQMLPVGQTQLQRLKQT